MKELIVVAVGGNSLIRDQAHIDAESQYENCKETCSHITALLKAGYRIVISHGNGPQVGFLLRCSELASAEVPRSPLGVCVANTQGSIGYMFQRAMYFHMQDWDNHPQVIAMVTQVIVDAEDPAFVQPNKPIGSFMDEETARHREKELGWQVVEDSGRGFRRVVPSPQPQEIVELPAISHLVSSGYVVVAVGGGGIPVARQEDGGLYGVDAVIDKDRASSLMARKIDADRLVISTAVDKVYLHFGKPEQKGLDVLTASEAKRYLDEGQFGAGSMAPKVEASIQFVEGGGKEAIITSPEHMLLALQGKAGTRIIVG